MRLPVPAGVSVALGHLTWVFSWLLEFSTYSSPPMPQLKKLKMYVEIESRRGCLLWSSQYSWVKEFWTELRILPTTKIHARISCLRDLRGNVQAYTFCVSAKQQAFQTAGDKGFNEKKSKWPESVFKGVVRAPKIADSWFNSQILKYVILGPQKQFNFSGEQLWWWLHGRNTRDSSGDVQN